MKVLVTGGSGFIGQHLIPFLQLAGHMVTNLDIVAPLDSAQRAAWREGSILDAASLERTVRAERPDALIHLAAYAVVGGRSLDEYKVNTDGTANVLAAVRAVGGLARLIITSTQHVRRPGSGPAIDDEDYAAHGYYGESKVITERLTRKAGLPGHWMIIRPTLVWGAYNMPMANGVWKVMHRGLYFHPAHDQVIRAYGYVRNICWQIDRIISLSPEMTHGRTLYVGDDNMRQLEWVNGFSLALTGRSVRTLPLGLVRGMSLTGDVLKKFGFGFPMYSTRFFNLVTENPVPMAPTFSLLGRGPDSMAVGIATTVSWLKTHYAQIEKGCR